MDKAYEKEWFNKFLIAISIIGIAFTFLFQEFSFLDSWNINDESIFVLRKALRVILNDFFMLIFIAAWFKDGMVTRLALLIQAVDSLVLLPIYLVIKLTIEGPSEISAPLLSQFHRIIINPTLMILLIPAIYFQKSLHRNKI